MSETKRGLKIGLNSRIMGYTEPTCTRNFTQ